MARLTNYLLSSSARVASFVFLIAALAAVPVIWSVEQSHLQQARALALVAADTYADALERGIERALSATYALAVLVRQGKGTIRDFDAIAGGMLPLYPGAGSLQLAPGGVVQSIVPLAGNERAIGLDLLNDPMRSRETTRARDTGKLVFFGPFNLVRGGVGAVGWLPVFFDDAKGEPVFWGFTSVLIRFPDILDAAELPQLEQQGFAYELWRSDPDTGQKLTIAASSNAALIDPIGYDLQLPDATWTLSVMPIEGWRDPLRLSIEVALGLLLSLLLAELAKTTVELRLHKQGLESLVLQRTAEVKASEARFRSLTEMSSDFYWESDAEHRLTLRGSADTKVSTVSVFQRGAQIGERRWEIPYLSPDEAGWQAHRAELDAHRPFREFELSRRGADGKEHFIVISGDPAFDAAGAFKGYCGVGTDITERKEAEARIRRLTQFYAALSHCNEAVARCTSEEELFSQICRAAVQFGGMKIAWIGMIDPDTRIVRPAASFGDHADEYLRGTEIPVDANSPLGGGRTGAAIRGDQPVWHQDSLNEPHIALWHERRVRFGLRASASLPLHRSGVTVGVLNLYADKVDAFDEAVRQLLVEMSTDIDFALDAFAREAARANAEEDLRAAEEQFRGLVEQSIAGIYIIQDGKFAYVNPRFAEIRGFGSADELIGRDPMPLIAEKDRSTVVENNRRLLAGETRSISYNFTALRKDGSTVEVGLHGSRATYRGRPAIIGLLQDISEKKRAEDEIERYVAQLKIAFMSTVGVATTLSEMRDPYTAGHERRVAEIAVAIGAELGWNERQQEGLRVAGYLHDVGKMTIPAEILSKPGRLSAIEFQLIQAHAQASYEVLKEVAFPWPVAQVALQHHERVDGSGYPQGLKGEAILLEARIMAVADVVEAMSSHRPYRAGLGIEAALAEIERGRDSAYDPVVVDACLKLFREKGYTIPA